MHDHKRNPGIPNKGGRDFALEIDYHKKYEDKNSSEKEDDIIEE